MSRAVLAGLFVGVGLLGVAGANPEAPKPAPVDETWWAYRPLTRPAVPPTTEAQRPWARNPIDHFILTRLKEKGLTPSPEAERQTLIRRLTFNLHGLPPAPAEIDAFVNDSAPDAYEKLVERLLASPRHGERWARHWMDVIHFAETHGHDQDVPRENAWPYRDYLIESFNRDKPYSRFIEEQIAGDILYPADPQATVALGFLAAGPWDESSLKDIREDSLDRKIGQYLDRDDMLTTVCLAFLSTTAQCARCHDHPFDPIAHEEYYGLQAIFAGVDRAERPYDDDVKVRQERLRLEKLLAELQGGPAAALKLVRADANLAAKVASWEKAQKETQETWNVLFPSRVRCSHGSEWERLADRSLLFGGQRPERESYLIEAPTFLDSVTALKLEVLPHASLPKKGPGRQDNGNLHLNEIEIQASPAPGEKVKVRIARAYADFNQQGWDINKAIDGKYETAWGIYPAVGQAHEAVFVFGTPIKARETLRLSILLEQLHGQGHLIGRLRLSVTDAVPQSVQPPLPPALQTILDKAPQQRSDTEQGALAAQVLKQRAEADLALLPRPKLVYAAANDFTPQGSFRPAHGCRPVHVLKRGDVRYPRQAAVPGALACVSGLEAKFTLADPSNEGQRRAALARWISNPKNGLTWRSIANRVWHYHFGRGLAATPSDLGKMGGQPTHPELLDWLACEIRDNGGSLKKLHRLILTSATYRQVSGRLPLHPPVSGKPKAQASPHSSPLHPSPQPRSGEGEAKNPSPQPPSRSGDGEPKAPPQPLSRQGRGEEKRNPQAIDADNLYLWRMNRERLDAESLRDAVLAVSGQLDLTMGGPSVRHFLQKPGIHRTPDVNYLAFDPDAPGAHRRSIYRFIFRTLPDPFLDALDCPDASQFTAVRSSSVTVLQALGLLNDAFMVRMSEHFAKRVASAGDTPAQVRLAYRLALGREPSPRELELVSAHARRHGLASACRALLNCNEFMFVD